jgi:hypothetical protein
MIFFVQGINGPLQERTNLLKIDLLRSKELFDDIEEDLTNKINETILLLTLSLNKHLNLGQNLTLDTPEVYMSFEKTSFYFLSNKQIQFSENAKINFPSNLNENQTILIRSRLDTLAPFGNYLSYTNLSRSLSVSIVNQNGNEMSIKTNNSIKLIIPRDPNGNVPKMILQNVTNHNQSFYFQLIHLKDLKLNKNLSISIHFQIEPLNLSLAYLFVYQFDKTIQSNQFDHLQVFCPSSKSIFFTRIFS